MVGCSRGRLFGVGWAKGTEASSYKSMELDLTANLESDAKPPNWRSVSLQVMS